MLEKLEALIKNAKSNKQKIITLDGKIFGDLVYSEYFAKEIRKLGYKTKFITSNISSAQMVISW